MVLSFHNLHSLHRLCFNILILSVDDPSPISSLLDPVYAECPDACISGKANYAGSSNKDGIQYGMFCLI